MKTLIILFLLVSSAYSQVDPFDYLGGQKLEADTAHNYPIGSAPSTPTLLTPSDASDSVSVIPTFDWSDVATATSYYLIVRDVNTGDTLLKRTTSVSNYTIGSDTLEYLTSYSWRVRAQNAYGNSSFATAFLFETIIEPLQNIFARSRILQDSGLFVVYNSLKGENPLYSGQLSIIKTGSPKKWYTSQDNGLTWDYEQDITEGHAGALYQGYYLDDNRDYIAYWSRIDAGIHYTYHVVKSTDGITWDSGYGVVNFDVRGTEVGEDATFFEVENSLPYIFFRDSTTQQAPYSVINPNQCPTRSISYGSITTNNTVIDRARIIPATLSNFYNSNSKDYRTCWNNMTVAKTGDDYWGFANVIRSHSSAKENQVGSTADSVTVRIYHSTSLSSGWVPINDTVSCIQLHGNRKQIFSQQPIVIGDSLIVFTEESDSRHNTTDATTPYWAWARYAIYIPTLNLYKP